MANDNSSSIRNPHEPSKPFICITLSSVTNLLPSNYLTWKLQVEAFLDGYDLLQYLDGSFPAPAVATGPNGLSAFAKDDGSTRDTAILFDDLLEKLLIQELSLVAAQQQVPAPMTSLNAVKQPIKAHVWMDSISGQPTPRPSTLSAHTPLLHSTIDLGIPPLLSSHSFSNIFLWVQINSSNQIVTYVKLANLINFLSMNPLLNHLILWK
uniref:Retrovirus-related Pol polyprotein from transposon TNT 1-94 n=1 Tax=Cajanus cajan TaxID=3821 RepID=A0A151QPA4_CAJCA|nr:hypothetical protein KK1_047310 [Cajanus cajan]